MSRRFVIKHRLGTLTVTPSAAVDGNALKSALYSTLDELVSPVPASEVHARVQARHGQAYGTAGYFLRVYRMRADLTQRDLAAKTGARQHHISEMEHNRRPIGKRLARKLAAALSCDHRRFL